jgi:hypothetical protein
VLPKIKYFEKRKQQKENLLFGFDIIKEFS